MFVHKQQSYTVILEADNHFPVENTLPKFRMSELRQVEWISFSQRAFAMMRHSSDKMFYKAEFFTELFNMSC